jgi:hypothetical protein
MNGFEPFKKQFKIIKSSEKRGQNKLLKNTKRFFFMP